MSTPRRRYLDLPDQHPQELPAGDGFGASWHILSKEEIAALNAALATGRPLLVRGEPGVGKSELARAAAAAFGRTLVHQTVDSHTETHDLLWTFDAVARLAEAQVMGSLRPTDPDAAALQVRERLEIGRFIQPGALWWALNPATAHVQAERGGYGACVVSQADAPSYAAGTVVLIDEIDKADPCVPNGLLDALGHGGFNVRDLGRVSACADGAPPLIVITTNEERALPAAFLRRCLVLHLRLPEGNALKDRLKQIGAVHFPKAHPDLLAEAADMFAVDRAELEARHLPPPGLAEYLDLIRAVVEQGGGAGSWAGLLAAARALTLQKHPAERRR